MDPYPSNTNHERRAERLTKYLKSQDLERISHHKQMLRTRNAILKIDINYGDVDNCCVCYRLCHAKTPCEHTLCINCFQKLKYQPLPDDFNEYDNFESDLSSHNFDNHEQQYVITCPYCREILLLKQ
jgi:hypothetical protein